AVRGRVLLRGAGGRVDRQRHRGRPGPVDGVCTVAGDRRRAAADRTRAVLLVARARGDRSWARSLGRRAGFVLEQPLAERVANELGAGRETKLLHDVRTVRLRRAHRDVERLRDLLVRMPEGEESQHLTLAD